MIHVEFNISYMMLYFYVINFISFFIYAYDKIKAIKNSQRTSENKLLFSSFIGGVIGSLLAMLFFRHKIKKVSFMIKFFILVLIQIILLFLYFKEGYRLYL